MRLDDFDFELPRAAIAQHPVTPRDSARLLVVGDRVDDRHVRDLPDLLPLLPGLAAQDGGTRGEPAA